MIWGLVQSWKRNKHSGKGEFRALKPLKPLGELGCSKEDLWSGEMLMVGEQ